MERKREKDEKGKYEDPEGEYFCFLFPLRRLRIHEFTLSSRIFN